MSRNELTVELNARLDRLEKALDRAQKSANDNFRKIEEGGEQAARKLDASFVESASKIATSLASVGGVAVTVWRQFDAVESAASRAGSAIGALAKLLIGYRVALITFAAVAAAIDEAKDSIEEMKKVGEAAEKAGLAPTVFQAWRDQAKLARIEAGDMEKALIRAREAVRERSDDQGRTAQNPVAGFLDELYRGGKVTGAGLGEFLAAGDTAQKIQAVKVALSEMIAQGRELQAMKLAEMVFGGDAAAKVIAGIQSGAIAVEQVGSAARQVGNVFDDALVKRADELDEALKRARDQMGNALLPLSQQLAAIGLDIQSGWVGINSAIANAVTGMANLLAASKSAFAAVSAANAAGYAERRAQARIGIATRGPDAIITDERIAEQRANADLQRQLRFNRPAPNTVDAGFLDASAAFVSRGAPLPASPPLPPTRPPISGFGGATNAPSGGGRSNGGDSFDNVEGFIDRLQKTVDMLAAEEQALGKSNAERQRLVSLASAEAAARQRATPLSDAERAKVEALAASHAKLSSTIERAKQAREGLRDLAELGVNGLADLIVEGRALNDVIGNMARQLARLAIQAALLGQGPLAGLFGGAASSGSIGGILGAVLPKFADGGVVRGPGGPREDRVLARLSPGEFVVNSDATARHRALLEQINAGGGLPRFAAGGLVGVSAPPRLASQAGAQNVTIAPSIAVNVEGGSRGEEHDEKLAGNIARQVEGSIRSVVCSELQRQMRPGNLLAR